MSPFIVDGVLYVPPTLDEEPEKPADEFRPAGEDSVAVVIAEIVGLAIGSALGDWGHRVLRALPPLANVVAILPVLPALVWHTVRYCLVEPRQQRRGERRG